MSKKDQVKEVEHKEEVSTAEQITSIASLAGMRLVSGQRIVLFHPREGNEVNEDEYVLKLGLFTFGSYPMPADIENGSFDIKPASLHIEFGAKEDHESKAGNACFQIEGIVSHKERGREEVRKFFIFNNPEKNDTWLGYVGQDPKTVWI